MNKNEENGVMLAIGRLEGKVDGINQRLDTSNGRIAKIEAKTDILEERVDKQDGAFKMVNWMWAAFLGLGGVFVSALTWFKN